VDAVKLTKLMLKLSETDRELVGRIVLHLAAKNDESKAWCERDAEKTAQLLRRSEAE